MSGARHWLRLIIDFKLKFSLPKRFLAYRRIYIFKNHQKLQIWKDLNLYDRKMTFPYKLFLLDQHLFCNAFLKLFVCIISMLFLIVFSVILLTSQLNLSIIYSQHPMKIDIKEGKSTLFKNVIQSSFTALPKFYTNASYLIPLLQSITDCFYTPTSYPIWPWIAVVFCVSEIAPILMFPQTS